MIRYTECYWDCFDILSIYEHKIDKEVQLRTSFKLCEHLLYKVHARMSWFLLAAIFIITNCEADLRGGGCHGICSSSYSCQALDQRTEWSSCQKSVRANLWITSLRNQNEQCMIIGVSDSGGTCSVR